jgi:hypothetical protein
METVVMVLTAFGPVIAAAIDAAQRGGDWKKAAREVLDAAEKADKGLAGPRADAIEAAHRERLARGDEKTQPVVLGRVPLRVPLDDIPRQPPRVYASDLDDEDDGA